MKDKKKELKEEILLKKITKEQNSIRKEYSYLKKSSAKYMQRDYILAQAKEWCKVINRMELLPFRAMESFIRDSILKNEEVFLYDFYLIKNEFGKYEPDIDRINSLILKDKPED